jgi:tetratricopeptide (TPR) repeat protein
VWGLLMAGRLAEGQALITSVIESARARTGDHELALTLHLASFLFDELEEHGLEPPGTARQLAEEALQLARRTEDRRLLRRSLLLVAQRLIFVAGDLAEGSIDELDEAERLLTEARAIDEEPEADIEVGFATTLADIALARGDRRLALERYAASLELADRLGDVVQTITDSYGVARILGEMDDPEAALEVDALISAIADDVGWGANRVLYRDYLTPLRNSAGAAEREAIGRARVMAPPDRVPRILVLARNRR